MNAAQILMLVLTVVPLAGMAYALYACIRDGVFGPTPTHAEQMEVLDRMLDRQAKEQCMGVWLENERKRSGLGA